MESYFHHLWIDAQARDQTLCVFTPDRKRGWDWTQIYHIAGTAALLGTEQVDAPQPS